MKILFIGGTGLISSACSELAVARGHELTILNRARSGTYPVPAGARLLSADMRGDLGQLRACLHDDHFDAVVDWIAFTSEHVSRDIDLFTGRTDQYVFISSASAYHKPPVNYLVTEATPLENPFWQYSREKIACEEQLQRAIRERGFPATIVRPSLTYGPSQIPLAVNSWQHPYTAVARIKQGKKLIVPGDGTSLWVMTWNEDFAVGLLGVLGNPSAVGEVFHITSDEVLSWNQIYHELFSALNREVNIVHIPSDLLAAYREEFTGSLIGDKSNSLVFDNSKIKRFVPEFNCATPWYRGLRLCLDWFEADPSRQIVDEQYDQLLDTIIQSYQHCFPGA